MKKLVLVLVVLMVASQAFATVAKIHTDMEMKWKISPTTLSNNQFGRFVNDKSLFNASMSLDKTSYKLSFNPASWFGVDQMNYLIKINDMFTWGGGLFYKSINPLWYYSNAWGLGFYFKPVDIFWLSIQTVNDSDYLELIPAIQIKPISILSFGVQFDYSMNTNSTSALGVDLSVKPAPIDFYLESYIGLGSTTVVNIAGWLNFAVNKTLSVGTEYELKDLTSTNLQTTISPYLKAKVAGIAIKPQLDLVVTPSVNWSADIEFTYDFDPLTLDTEKKEAK